MIALFNIVGICCFFEFIVLPILEAACSCHCASEKTNR